MELTIVGCSGSVSGPDSTASCYLVRAPYEGRTYALVLDLGPGSFGQLYRYLDPAQVDAIGLSHLHPDHCLDLTGFAQRGDVLAGFAQGVGELLVLADRLGELALRLEQPFLEGVDAAGRIGESRSQVRDLLDQGCDLDRLGLVIVRTVRVEFTVVRHGPNVHAGVGNMFARTLPCKLQFTLRRSTPCAVPLTRSCY